MEVQDELMKTPFLGGRRGSSARGLVVKAVDWHQSVVLILLKVVVLRI